MPPAATVAAECMSEMLRAATSSLSDKHTPAPVAADPSRSSTPSARCTCDDRAWMLPPWFLARLPENDTFRATDSRDRSKR
eukprot:2669745-Rhodomonas_salina.1